MIDNWDNLFNGSMQVVLPKPVSYHFPILFDGGLRRGPLLSDLRTYGRRRGSKNWLRIGGCALILMGLSALF